MDRSQKIASLLLNLKCVEFSTQPPFTYASGLKGPIYCDNRLLLGNPSARDEITNGLVETISEKMPGDAKDHIKIVGMATAGIAPAAIVANKMALPMGYLRSKPKSHGKGKLIEGGLQSGDEVIVLEDLVNQGTSVGFGIEELKKAGMEVLGCYCIVDYQTPTAQTLMRKHQVKLYCLTDLDTLTQVAKDSGFMTSDQYDMVQSWRNDPTNWQ